MAAVTWTIDLIDRLTRPAGVMDRALYRLEGQMLFLGVEVRNVNRHLTALGTRFNSAALAGEVSARRIQHAWGRLGTSMRGITGDLQAAAMGGAGVGFAAYGAGMAAKGVIDKAGAREGALMSMGILLKTKDQAQIRSAAAWVDRFADITPFEDRDVMQSVRKLLGYKFTFDQVKGLARVTGDAASAMGSDPGDANMKWEIINRALGQIKAKGRLQGDELLQLQEAGISTDEYLKKAVGPNYRKLQEAGKISSAVAIRAIVEGMNRDFGGGMSAQSQTLFGLASTLKSRPQRLFGQLFDMGGLEDMKRFFRNLTNLTDFEKDPGKRALRKMVDSGKKLTHALFGPLADATEGGRADQLVDGLTDRLDRITAWWETNGPRLGQEVKGFGQGFGTAAQGAEAVLKPLAALAGLFDRAGGGDGQGMIGKLLGFGLGAALIGRLGNYLTFGALGRVGGRMATALVGAIRIGFIRHMISARWIGATLMRSVRAVGWARALGLSDLGSALIRGLSALRTAFTAGGVLGVLRTVWTTLRGWGLAVRGAVMASSLLSGALAGLSGVAAAVFTPITLGAAAIAATILGVVKLGDVLYARWTPFADLIDRIKSGIYGIANPGAWRGTGTGALDEGGQFMNGLNAMSRRLGIKSGDLLKVMNLESGVSASAVNPDSQATGLIQFLPSTARELGTTVEALAKMSRTEQLPYVERYLKMHGVTQGAGLQQLYMSILAGNAGRDGVLWRAGSDEYTQNAGLDVNGDKVITAAEATAQVETAWKRDRAAVYQTLNVTIGGNADPAAVAAFQQAAQQGALGALNTVGLEGGWAP